MICPGCKNNLPETSFYRKNKGKNRCSYCKTCTGSMVKARRKELKIKAVKYLGSKCSKCGYSKSYNALQFHHRDPTKKDFGISSKGLIKFESIKSELDKCILVCANCHAEIHDETLGG